MPSRRFLSGPFDSSPAPLPSLEIPLGLCYSRGMKRAIVPIFILSALLCFACGSKVTAEVPSPTAAPTAEATAEATPQPVPTPTEVAIVISEQTPAPTDTPQPTEAPTPAPTATPTSSPAPVATPEPEVLREDLSRRCTFTSTQRKVPLSALIDDNLQTSVILSDKTGLTYAWGEDVPASVLYLFAYVMPEAIQIRQQDGTGAVLQEKEMKLGRMCLQLPLLDGCRQVTVKFQGRCKINAFQIFGPGNAFPERVVYWADRDVDHCDLMLISTHFDDEILMMGGVLPLYAGEQRKDCQVVYMKGKDQIRKLEAIQGLWEMGVRREAIYLKCTSNSLQKALDNDAAGTFAKDNLQKLVYLLRRYRPLVVVTHDVNGEYGHESHIKTSALVRRAVELAADGTYDPDTAAQYGLWQVQKEYIHLWPENALELDIESPLPRMGGRSAFEVAQAAFTYHKTQQKNWSVSATHAKQHMDRFGLYFSAVGPDSGLNDMFENVTAP